MSRWLTFAGANIKGNPKMPTTNIAHDLRAIFRVADVAVLQEFHWRSYWWTLRQFISGATSYDTAPVVAVGLVRPTFAGQAIVTKRGTGRITKTWARLLHKGKGGISESRWLRAAKVKTPNGECIYGTTHNVVGGDGPGDGPLRKAMLANDLDRLAAFLDELLEDGAPIVFELDGNIHHGTAAWMRIRHIVTEHGGEFVGELGVEFLFWIQGSTSHLVPHPTHAAGTIPTSQLKTDHEVRLFTHRLTTPEEMP